MEAIADARQLEALLALIEAQDEHVTTLRRAVEHLEGRLAIRSELDTMVAHDVRTPLTVVHGVLTTLTMLPADHPDRIALIDQALAHTRRLSETVKYLLMSEEPACPLPPDGQEWSAFDRITDRVIDELARRVPTATVIVGGSSGLVVDAAAGRLEIVILHLVEHAARRDPDGLVELRAEPVGGGLRVEVADRGAPLPDTGDARFATAPASLSLYLARMLARSMRADVRVGDRPGGGCLAVLDVERHRS